MGNRLRGGRFAGRGELLPMATMFWAKGQNPTPFRGLVPESPPHHAAQLKLLACASRGHYMQCGMPVCSVSIAV